MDSDVCKTNTLYNLVYVVLAFVASVLLYKSCKYYENRQFTLEHHLPCNNQRNIEAVKDATSG